MTILPAIDLIDGRCVRLSQGDYAQKKQYDARPVDMVRQYVAHGLHRVHVGDFEGAKASTPQNLDTLRQLAAVPGAEIEWGGMLRWAVWLPPSPNSLRHGSTSLGLSAWCSVPMLKTDSWL